LFFDAEFNRTLFETCIRVLARDVLEQTTDENGVVHQRLRFRPTLEIPAPIRKLIGDGSYTESGRFDPNEAKYVAEWRPDLGSDRFETRMEVWTEPVGDRRCERIMVLDNTVKLFGLGSMIERMLEEPQRKTMTQVADFNNRWIREHDL
jgi:hypothetical protein